MRVLETRTAVDSNEELAEQAAGDRSEARQKEAFDELFRRLWRVSVEWSRSAGISSADLAQDAATQAWFRAWKYRHRYDARKGSYANWLWSIVRNESTDLLRTESRHQTRCSSPDEEQADPSTFDEPELFQFPFVWDAYTKLCETRPDFAMALRLKALGYTDREIAHRLGVDRVGTIGSRIWRAKRFLVIRLAQQGIAFIPAGDSAPAHAGLKLLCGTGDGAFYAVDRDGPLVVVPDGTRAPDQATRLSGAYFAAIWVYPPRQELARGPGSAPFPVVDPGPGREEPRY